MRTPLRVVIPVLVSLGLFACGSSDPIKSEGLAGSSVTADKLAAKSVTNPKLADAAVDARALAPAAVTSPALAAGAVTTAAIASGAVTSSQMADNSVSSAAIADGSVGTSELAAKAVTTGTIDDKAVTTNKLNDGAVTTAKIAGGAVTAASLAPNAAVLGLNGLVGGVTVAGGQNISVSKSGNTISVGITGNVNAMTLDNNDAATFARRDTHVITVAKSGGDYGTIGAALASIASPSSTNAYLIRVGPGVFTEQVQMKAYVDIEGAGINVTTISLSAQNLFGQGTVIGAPNSELRDVTVESTGPGAGSGTGFAANGTAASLSNVRINAKGAQFNDYGLYASGTGSQILARNVTVNIAGAGTRAYGVYADSGAKVVLRDSTIAVPTTAASTSANSLFDGGGGVFQVANTMIDSGVSGAPGAFSCSGVFSAQYVSLGAACN